MTVKELKGYLSRLPKGDENAEIRFSERKQNGFLHHCFNFDNVERVVDKKGKLLWISLK